MIIDKTQDEILALIDKARETDGTLTGMTYEEGIVAALDWILSRGENPID